MRHSWIDRGARTGREGGRKVRGRSASVGVVLGLGAATAGGWWVVGDGADRTTSPPLVTASRADPTVPSTAVPAPPVTVPDTTTSAPQAQPPPPPPPAPEDLPATPPPVITRAGRLRIDTLGVEAAVVEVRVRPDGELEVPPDPSTVGWWAEGARPGGGSGSVVIDGHVDTARDGPGAFFRLGSMTVGDAVEVTAADGSTHRYRVTTTARYPKDDLPAAEVFAQDGAERLVLITCGGDFDDASRHYADNVVVFADPA